MTEGPTINWSDALAAVGGDRKILEDVIDAFYVEVETRLEEIHQAHQMQDAPLLRRAAHTIKGSLRIFDTPLASSFAERLEIMGRDGEFDGVLEALAALEEQLEGVTAAMRKGPPDSVSE